MKDDVNDFEVEGARFRSKRALRSDSDLIPLSSAVAIVRKRLDCTGEEAKSYILGCVGTGKVWGIDLVEGFDDPNADPPELADPNSSGGEAPNAEAWRWPRQPGQDLDWIRGQIAKSELE